MKQATGLIDGHSELTIFYEIIYCASTKKRIDSVLQDGGGGLQIRDQIPKCDDSVRSPLFCLE